MNGRMAKKIRLMAYGEGYSVRHRKYKWDGPKIVANEQRRNYRLIKKLYTRGKLSV